MIMKERIEEKLQNNIERILEKEELAPSDVAILKEELSRIELEENKEANKEKYEEAMKLIIGNGFSNN